MATTSDRDLFFQTTQSLDQAEQKAKKSNNEHGSPIRLPSKVLAIIPDPSNNHAVFTAESAGTARRIDLETRETKQIYRGPTAPLTALTVSFDGKTLYGGSWDKTIWSWDVDTGAAGRRFSGHIDFVKALLFLQSKEETVLLISGSADASLIIWDAMTGSRLHVLKGHTRGILALALDPVALAESQLVIFSGSSDPHIRRWRLSIDLSKAEEVDPENPILQHETSVNALWFDEEGDLWTASSDGTAKCLSRERGWKEDTVLRHGDYVRGVAVDEIIGLAVTVGRDEEVKVWQKGSESLWHTYCGHFEEITACALVGRQQLVTVGIDCTVRQWSLALKDLEEAREAAARAKNDLPGEGGAEVEPKSMLTEDEERELAELMDDD